MPGVCAEAFPLPSQAAFLWSNYLKCLLNFLSLSVPRNPSARVVRERVAAAPLGHGHQSGRCATCCHLATATTLRAATKTLANAHGPLATETAALDFGRWPVGFPHWRTLGPPCALRRLLDICSSACLFFPNQTLACAHVWFHLQLPASLLSGHPGTTLRGGGGGGSGSCLIDLRANEESANKGN